MVVGIRHSDGSINGVFTIFRIKKAIIKCLFYTETSTVDVVKLYTYVQVTKVCIELICVYVSVTQSIEYAHFKTSDKSIKKLNPRDVDKTYIHNIPNMHFNTGSCLFLNIYIEDLIHRPVFVFSLKCLDAQFDRMYTP